MRPRPHDPKTEANSIPNEPFQSAPSTAANTSENLDKLNPPNVFAGIGELVEAFRTDPSLAPVLANLRAQLEAALSEHGSKQEGKITEQLVASASVHDRGSALSQELGERPTRGAITCLGSLPLPLRQGDFKAYVFESTQSHDHLIAVTKGDISSDEPLLVRVHSECITSETLCGCDCDCVEQLEGALSQIEEEGRGILFYLRQEGRGAGYSNKARDRMLVCASENELGTFDAYRGLGLPEDRRNYESLRDVAYLLDINAPLIVMTNNPDKLNGLRQLGFTVESRSKLTIPPNPHNAYYLKTKGENGHMLDKSDTMDQEEQAIQSAYPWEVKAFVPHSLDVATRYTHNASYPLPIRPLPGVLVLDPKQVGELYSIQSNLGVSLIQNMETLSYGKFHIQLDANLTNAKLEENAHGPLAKIIGANPHWFNTHVYRDSIAGLDYVTLEYNVAPLAAPIVRVHSENLLDRFPSSDTTDTSKYQRSIDTIVKNGRGLLLLYPEDGRGKGLSGTFLERMLVAKGAARNSSEASAILGTEDDRRDYAAIAKLVRHHYPHDNITLLFSSTDSIPKKQNLLACLLQEGVKNLNLSYLNKSRKG